MIHKWQYSIMQLSWNLYRPGDPPSSIDLTPWTLANGLLSSMYPAGLIEETLRTLALLFPQLDKDTRTWFKRAVSSTNIDFNAIRCGQLRAEDRHIDQFKFWRDRLVVLKQVFDEAEPATWSQWWYDRRKGVRRYPFLLAAAALALTLLFGLIICVEGGLQVYKAYYPS